MANIDQQRIIDNNPKKDKPASVPTIEQHLDITFRLAKEDIEGLNNGYYRFLDFQTALKLGQASLPEGQRGFTDIYGVATSDPKSAVNAFLQWMNTPSTFIPDSIDIINNENLTEQTRTDTLVSRRYKKVRQLSIVIGVIDSAVSESPLVALNLLARNSELWVDQDFLDEKLNELGLGADQIVQLAETRLRSENQSGYGPKTVLKHRDTRADSASALAFAVQTAKQYSFLETGRERLAPFACLDAMAHSCAAVLADSRESQYPGSYTRNDIVQEMTNFFHPFEKDREETVYFFQDIQSGTPDSFQEKMEKYLQSEIFTSLNSQSQEVVLATALGVVIASRHKDVNKPLNIGVQTKSKIDQLSEDHVLRRIARDLQDLN